MAYTSSFKLLYCSECEKVFQNTGGSGGGYGPKLIYYTDFPSISCKKEICPKCTEDLSVVEEVSY